MNKKERQSLSSIKTGTSRSKNPENNSVNESHWTRNKRKQQYSRIYKIPVQTTIPKQNKGRLKEIDV